MICRIDELLDPADHEAKLELTNLRARAEGGDVFLEILADRLLWNKASETLQDLAIAEAGRRLGGGYRFVEARVYRVPLVELPLSVQRLRDQAKKYEFEGYEDLTKVQLMDRVITSLAMGRR